MDLAHLRVNKRGNWGIPRLKTVNGLSGLGDASQSTSDEQCIQFLKQYLDMLRGRSIFDIARFRRASAPIRAAHGGSYGTVQHGSQRATAP